MTSHSAQKLQVFVEYHDILWSSYLGQDTGECCGIRKGVIEGKPVKKDISTSYVERSNLSLRMHNRSFTRLTNAFSKKFENHVHMISLYTVFYNFVRIHKTLKMSPAMAAVVTDELLEMEDNSKVDRQSCPEAAPSEGLKKQREFKLRHYPDFTSTLTLLAMTRFTGASILIRVTPAKALYNIANGQRLIRSAQSF